MKRFFSLEPNLAFPKEINEYVMTFDVFKESNLFKNICAKEEGNISENTFIKARSQHAYRRDITPD